MILHPTIREGSGQEGLRLKRAAILVACAATRLAGRTWLQRRHPEERAKAVEGPAGAYTIGDMTSRNHISGLLRRVAALVAFVALLWAIQVVNWISGYGLNPAFGLIPRSFGGLDGIIAMPLVHGSFAHLMANTPPLLVMGGLMVATTTRALLPVNAVVIGLVDRSLITLGAALVVGVLYGSILWGVLAGQPGVSWEAHLFGVVAGAAAAFLVRTHVHAPRLSDVDLD